MRIRLQLIRFDNTRYRVELFSGGRSLATGYLPCLPPELRQALENWRENYRNLVGDQSLMVSTSVAYGDVGVTQNQYEQLVIELNNWIEQSPQFIPIRDELVILSRNDQEFQIVLSFDCEQDDLVLKQLPWQRWNFLQKYYPNSEVTLSAEWRNHTSPYPRSSTIRILFVLGQNISTEYINATSLWHLFNLPNRFPNQIEIRTLSAEEGNLSIQSLQQELIDRNGYHILICIVHSRSSADGRTAYFQLTKNQELNINSFYQTLNTAVQNGLKLSILDSCANYGAANRFAGANLSQFILVKELIPVDAAAAFLNQFFRSFSGEGYSLLRSVNEARTALEGFQGYPGVADLPTVYIGPNEESLTWNDLIRHLPRPGKRRWPIIFKDFILQIIAKINNSTSRIFRSNRSSVCYILLACLTAMALLFLRWYQGGFTPPLPTPPSIVSPTNLISAGEQLLSGNSKLSSYYQEKKEKAIQDFSEADPNKYLSVIDSFENIRKEAIYKRDTNQCQKENKDTQDCRDVLAVLQDPEIVIYKNNAKARYRKSLGEKIYTIAAAVPLTDKNGNFFEVGRHILWGVAQAQQGVIDEIDDKQLNLEVVIVNDRNSPSQAKAIAKELTKLTLDNEGRKILAVVGHYTSPITCAALPIYKAAGVTIVSPTSTLTNLREECESTLDKFFFKYNEVFFRTPASSAIETWTLLDYIKKLYEERKIAAPKIAIFYNRNEMFSNDLFTQLANSIRGTSNIDMIGNFDLSDQNFDASTALENVKEASILAVFPDGRTENDTAYRNSIEVLKKGVAQKDRVILGSNPLYNMYGFINEDTRNKLANKLFLAIDWHYSCSATKFKDDGRSLWFGDVNRVVALSYEAVQVLFKPFKEDKTSLVDLQSNFNTVVTSDVFQPNRNLSFDENGNRRGITKRILATPSSSKNDFDLVYGENACEMGRD